jgi:hypothetical protein
VSGDERAWQQVDSLGDVEHICVQVAPPDVAALLRRAATEIERHNLRLVSLSYESDHADEYGAVLHLYVRRR